MLQAISKHFSYKVQDKLHTSNAIDIKYLAKSLQVESTENESFNCKRNQDLLGKKTKER